METYEQAVGFLRINNGKNPLDNTGIHPESYELTTKILNKLNLSINDIKRKEFKETLEQANTEDTHTYFGEQAKEYANQFSILTYGKELIKIYESIEEVKKDD